MNSTFWIVFNVVLFLVVGPLLIYARRTRGAAEVISSRDCWPRPLVVQEVAAR